MTLPAILADPGLDRTAVGVLVGIALLALIVAGGLVLVAARQAKTIRVSNDRAQRGADLIANLRMLNAELHADNTRMHAEIGQLRAALRPRMQRPGPPEPPTVVMNQPVPGPPALPPRQANHGGAT